MLHLYHRWRYNRAQRADAFKLPATHREGDTSRYHFGSYLSQQAVRGKVASPIDQSKQRRRWIQRITIMLLLMALGWILYESLQALQALSE